MMNILGFILAIIAFALIGLFASVDMRDIVRFFRKKKKVNRGF